MSDNRQYPRYAVEASVTLRYRDVSITGRSRDVSRGGFCAMMEAPIPPGAEVSARLALVFDQDTFSEPLDLPARVAWCTAIGEAHQVGCAFITASDEQGRYLDMFLRFLGSESPDDGGSANEDPFA